MYIFRVRPWTKKLNVDYTSSTVWIQDDALIAILKSFVVECAVLNVVISEIKVDYPRADMWH